MEYKDKKLIALIADEETITGFMFTGLECLKDEKSNFYTVTPTTSDEELNRIFDVATKREDVAIVFISDFVYKRIGDRIRAYKKMLPSLMEVPSQFEHPVGE